MISKFTALIANPTKQKLPIIHNQNQQPISTEQNMHDDEIKNQQEERWVPLPYVEKMRWKVTFTRESKILHRT